MSLFLTSSSRKQWTWLYLHHCYIQDRGVHIIHKYINLRDISITRLWLTNSGLTSSSSKIISDIVLSCKVEWLDISGNHTIGENAELYTMLTVASSLLTKLCMIDISLSSFAARTLFTVVKDTNKLKWLNISSNTYITAEVVDELITALTTNRSLVTLIMTNTYTSGEAILTILEGLKSNSTLQVLWLPAYNPAVTSRIGTIKQEINIIRKSQGIPNKLRIYYL